MNFQLKWETHLQMAELWLQFLIARVSPRISISKQMSHQNSTSSMGVQASPTYYLAFWLGSPLPNHIQPWLIAHFLLIKSLFQLSLSCLEFLIFRFAEKSQSFFLVWVSSQDVFLTSLFFVGEIAMFSGELHPLGPTRGDLERFNSRSAARLDKRLARTKSNSSRNLERDQRGPLRLGTPCWPSSNAWFHPWIGSKSTGNHRFWAPKGLKGF